MKYKKLFIIGALLLVLILWFISWCYVDNLFPQNSKDYLSNRGTFGDKFGFINSLFSGLALTGIIISIYFQQYELSLQRKELSETRKEFKDQNFQTTFFNLLKTQRQIAEEIDCYTWNLKSYDKEIAQNIKGRQFFNISKSEMIRITKALKNKKYLKYYVWSQEDEFHGPQSEWEADELTKERKTSYTFYIYNITEEIYTSLNKNDENAVAELTYSIFLNKYHFVVGHYFRHLYHILNFLESYESELILSGNNDDINIGNFANFIQAQMSTPEMFLLYYNCYRFPKLKRLIIKYNILENLNEEDLISKDHKIGGIRIKSRKVITL